MQNVDGLRLGIQGTLKVLDSRGLRFDVLVSQTKVVEGDAWQRDRPAFCKLCTVALRSIEDRSIIPVIAVESNYSTGIDILDVGHQKQMPRLLSAATTVQSLHAWYTNCMDLGSTGKVLPVACNKASVA